MDMYTPGSLNNDERPGKIDTIENVCRLKWRLARRQGRAITFYYDGITLTTYPSDDPRVLVQQYRERKQAMLDRWKEEDEEFTQKQNKKEIIRATYSPNLSFHEVCKSVINEAARFDCIIEFVYDGLIIQADADDTIDTIVGKVRSKMIKRAMNNPLTP